MHPSDRHSLEFRYSADYSALWPIDTRWEDNDHYGHVNNVKYYSYFDSAVNGWLIQQTGVDIRRLPAIGLVVETSCTYRSEISFPDRLDVGIAVQRLGNSSITYELGLFRKCGAGESTLCATGRFVHVYVDRQTRRPVPVPEVIATKVTTLVRRTP